MRGEVPKPSLVEVFEFYGLRILGRDAGGWRRAECPIPDHEDQNPSASINEDKCRWYCHTCARGGDAVDLILEREPGARWIDALKRAEEFTGGGDRPVREERGSSSLLPRRSGGERKRGKGVAPWMRF